MGDKVILDVTCGSRGIWFDKENPYTIYADKRRYQEEGVFGKRQAKDTINVNPDVIADFENLPFEDNTFGLVVFDPPHLVGKDESWLKKKYGYYESTEEAIQSVSRGINECMRVLKPNGVLIFKWSEIEIPTRDIISKCGYMPLFGHRSGKKMNTHWLTFMKLPLENEQLSLFAETTKG